MPKNSVIHHFGQALGSGGAEVVPRLEMCSKHWWVLFFMQEMRGDHISHRPVRVQTACSCSDTGKTLSLLNCGTCHVFYRDKRPLWLCPRVFDLEDHFTGGVA